MSNIYRMIKQIPKESILETIDLNDQNLSANQEGKLSHFIGQKRFGKSAVKQQKEAILL